MIPGFNAAQRQLRTPLPLKETAKKEKAFRSLMPQQKEKEEIAAFVLPTKVNDPAQWDEAWFANYE